MHLHKRLPSGWPSLEQQMIHGVHLPLNLWLVHWMNVGFKGSLTTRVSEAKKRWQWPTQDNKSQCQTRLLSSDSRQIILEEQEICRMWEHSMWMVWQLADLSSKCQHNWNCGENGEFVLRHLAIFWDIRQCWTQWFHKTFILQIINSLNCNPRVMRAIDWVTSCKTDQHEGLKLKIDPDDLIEGSKGQQKSKRWSTLSRQNKSH